MASPRHDGSPRSRAKKAASSAPLDNGCNHTVQLKRISLHLSTEASWILDFYYFVIQVFRDKVVDCRDIASDGLIETLTCLLSGRTAYGATWERRTLCGITAGVIPNYSDGQLHLFSLSSRQKIPASDTAVPEESFRPSPHLLDDHPC